MTTQELKQRYNELYAIMKDSKNVQNMRVFGEAFTHTFGEVAEKHPELAQNIINMLSAVEYHNFVTADEASAIAAKFINDDTMLVGSDKPTLGAKWRMDDLRAFLTAHQLTTSDKPYYNWPALWLTTNMIYSDFADTLVKLLGTKDSERIATACYEMAVAKLKDADKPMFVRDYFHL